MAPKQEANLFNKIIAEGRERKKNEERANAMLGAGRRSSAPSATNVGLRKATNGSLASRMGISKNQRQPLPAARPVSATPSNARNGSLLSRPPPPRPASESRLDRKARAVSDLFSSEKQKSNLRNQVNFTDHTTNSAGFSFRGKAAGELTTVMAQNFAPGTTAADIESVMQPLVDEDVVCRVVAARPTVIAEIKFRERSSAEKVVATFNNKKADGRTLYVYVQDPTNAPVPAKPPPSGPRADRNTRRQEEDDTMEVDEDRRRYDEERRFDEERRSNARRAETDYQDGRYGFQEPRPYEDARPAGPRDTRLYSDVMVGGRGGKGYRRR